MIKVNAWFYRDGNKAVLVELEEFNKDGTPRVFPEPVFIQPNDTVFDYLQNTVGSDFTPITGLGDMPKPSTFYRFEGHFVFRSSRFWTDYGYDYEEDYEWHGTWREATVEEAAELAPYVS